MFSCYYNDIGILNLNVVTNQKGWNIKHIRPKEYWHQTLECLVVTQRTGIQYLNVYLLLKYVGTPPKYLILFPIPPTPLFCPPVMSVTKRNLGLLSSPWHCLLHLHQNRFHLRVMTTALSPTIRHRRCRKVLFCFSNCISGNLIGSDPIPYKQQVATLRHLWGSADHK